MPLQIIDDLGMRKLGHTAAEDLLELIFSVLCESAFEALRRLPASPIPPNQSVIAVAPMPFPDRRHYKVVRRSEGFVRSQTRERRSMLLLVETNTFQRRLLPMGRTNRSSARFETAKQVTYDLGGRRFSLGLMA